VRFPFAEYTIFLRLKKSPLAKTPLLIEPTQPQIYRPSEFLNLKAFGSGFQKFWHVNSGNFWHGLYPPARSLPGLVNEPVEAVSLPQES
jgi:hypothetical protein